MIKHSNKELIAYEASEKSSRDAKARESYVREEGRMEGMKEGEERGEKRGIEQVALNMLKQDMDIETISKVTGLSVEDIKKLKTN